MEALVAAMAFCEAPFEGTLAQPVPTGHGASTTDIKKSGGDAPTTRISSLAASAKQAVNNCLSNGQVEALAATMAFCEAPFEGTLAPPVSTGHTSDPKKRGDDGRGDQEVVGGGGSEAVRKN